MSQMELQPQVVAFIPARSGSKRIANKNIRTLGGHPLLAYSICAAIDSGIFSSVICVTDDQLYANIAIHYGAEVPALRPVEISGDKSSDIEWVRWILFEMEKSGKKFDAFSILRPTSPLRNAETIKRAWLQFSSINNADSLRAVEKCKQHPGKMWVKSGKYITPVMPFNEAGTPWHSMQYTSLPEVYVQNASLEIAWTSVPINKHSIAGDVIIPFFTTETEGQDVNYEYDLLYIDNLISSGMATLPAIKKETWRT